MPCHLWPAKLATENMKASQFFISTLKEAPADAEVVSHQLMTRAGMIKRLGAGVYTLMPMGLRVVHKVAAIVREEMNRAGAVELSMPMVQPAELWQETGRFDKMGPELLRIKDRHERDFVIQPTSEEVVTDIARQELRSYKQLPKNFYQIQTKFRDERRPRFPQNPKTPGVQKESVRLIPKMVHLFGISQLARPARPWLKMNRVKGVKNSRVHSASIRLM